MEEAKVLIVDDDPDIVEALKMTLEANRYKVYTAANGTEGLKQVKAVKPDLIILDVMMDTITEGFQVSYQLRNPDPKSEYAPYSQDPHPDAHRHRGKETHEVLHREGRRLLAGGRFRGKAHPSPGSAGESQEVA